MLLTLSVSNDSQHRWYTQGVVRSDSRCCAGAAEGVLAEEGTTRFDVKSVAGEEIGFIDVLVGKRQDFRMLESDHPCPPPTTTEERARQRAAQKQAGVLQASGGPARVGH